MRDTGWTWSFLKMDVTCIFHKSVDPALDMIEMGGVLNNMTGLTGSGYGTRLANFENGRLVLPEITVSVLLQQSTRTITKTRGSTMVKQNGLITDSY